MRDRVSMALWAAALVVLALAGCGGGSPMGPSGVPAPSSALPAPSSAPILEGAYHSFEPWTGDHLGELPGNWRLAHGLLSGSDTRPEIDSYFRTGRQMSIEVFMWGFRPKANFWKPRQIDWILREDWEESFAQLEVMLRPHQADIWSILVVDEPTGRGLDPVHVATAVEWWNERGYATQVNEQLSRLSRPVNVTHFGITCYQQDKASGCWRVDWEACRQGYEATGADVVLGFGFQSWGCAMDPADLESSRRLASDVGAEALLWFLWPSTLGMQGMDSLGPGSY